MGGADAEARRSGQAGRDRLGWPKFIGDNTTLRCVLSSKYYKVFAIKGIGRFPFWYMLEKVREGAMSKVVYVSKSTLERKRGPLRVAHLPGEAQPVVYSVHGAIAEHYKVDPAKIGESHAATIDYVISATAG